MWRRAKSFQETARITSENRPTRTQSVQDRIISETPTVEKTGFREGWQVNSSPKGSR